MSEWYCSGCEASISGNCVTSTENCDFCGTPVICVEADHVAVPIAFIKAVAHVGVDFGHGKYVLSPEEIQLAREILDKHEKVVD